MIGNSAPGARRTAKRQAGGTTRRGKRRVRAGRPLNQDWPEGYWQSWEKVPDDFGVSIVNASEAPSDSGLIVEDSA